jgi:outer membrane protein assembly factor BamB
MTPLRAHPHASWWIASLVVVVALLASAALGADWPQWRGPTRDGISKETGLLKQWPAEGPKLLWQVKDLGSGYGAPSVVGEHLYVQGNKGLDDEFVEARKVADGSRVWSARIGKVGNPNQRPNYPAARATPTIDGDVLYALSSDGDLVCLDRAGGKEKWKKSLRADFGGKPGEWAYAESPLIDGDALLVTPSGAEATLVALNKTTGDVIWKSAVPGGDAAGYGSITVTSAAGVKQYAQMLAKGLVGVDAKTGAFLWRYDRTAKGSPANMMTAVAQGDVVYSSATRTGGGAVRISKGEDGKLKAEEVYFNPKLPTAIGGAVLVGDHLYGTTNAVMVCAEFKTGKIQWTDRSIGAASLLSADGLLFCHGENGDVALIEATPAAYRELGRFTPPAPPNRGNSKAWAYPTLASGRLFIRDADVLWCFDVKTPATRTARAE